MICSAERYISDLLCEGDSAELEGKRMCKTKENSELVDREYS